MDRNPQQQEPHPKAVEAWYAQTVGTMAATLAAAQIQRDGDYSPKDVVNRAYELLEHVVEHGNRPAI